MNDLTGQNNNSGLSEEYASIFESVYGNEYRQDSSHIDKSSLEHGNRSSDQNEYEEYNETSYIDNPIEDNANLNKQDKYDNYDDNYSADRYDYDDESDFDFDNDFDYEDNDNSSSSLKDYLGAKLTGTIFRIRGSVPASSSSTTMSDEEDELGREVTPRYAMKYYSSFVPSLKRRTTISFFILLIIVLLSIGFPFPGTLKNMTARIMCITALQFGMMLLSVDVITNSFVNIFSGKFGADALVVLSLIATTFDALSLRFTSAVSMHMPFCAVSSLSLFGLLLSSYLSTKGLRKALRVPAIAHKMYTVTGEENIIGKDITILKSTRPIIGYVRRMEEAPIDETAFQKFAPFIVIISVALSVLLVIFKKCYYDLLFVFSAVFAPAVPFTALLCFALPFFIGSNRIFSHGTALAGWSGAYDIGLSKNLIVTDRDLFPDSFIEIENVRIFANYDSNKVISYACSLIKESGSALSAAFDKLLEENKCQYIDVDSFEVLQGGGFKGLIEGHVVTCGSTDLMRLLDVRLPFRLVNERPVLLSIDGVLYGIFNMKYSADPDVRKALVNLMKSNRHPVFATRDFNITPDMIREVYDVATDGYDFPPYQERFPISKARPAQDSKISAVICREGLGPLIVMADTARSIYVITKINVAVSITFSFLAMIIIFLKLFLSGTISIGMVLLYMFFTSLPVIILGILTKAPN